MAQSVLAQGRDRRDQPGILARGLDPKEPQPRAGGGWDTDPPEQDWGFQLRMDNPVPVCPCLAQGQWEGEGFRQRGERIWGLVLGMLLPSRCCPVRATHPSPALTFLALGKPRRSLWLG